ncbi:MAG: CRISPR-associated endonuclease Cas1 [Vitreimonas sp.]
MFPGDPIRPTRIIVLDAPGVVTFDAIDWLTDQDTALIRIDWSGRATVIAGSAYAAGGEAWRRQVELRADPRRRMVFARGLIRGKLEASLVTLENCIPASTARRFALDVIGDKLCVLRTRKALRASDLHGIEGRAAKVYFDAWAGTPLNWKISKRQPIPDGWRVIGQRQSLLTGKKGKNYNASHPLNAMLNYAYAVLESQVRLDVLARGYDPRSGFLHMSGREQPSLVLDLMEPLRPVVDAGILSLASKEIFSRADFVLRSDGVVRLNPQLARRVAQVAAACDLRTQVVPSNDN